MFQTITDIDVTNEFTNGGAVRYRATLTITSRCCNGADYVTGELARTQALAEDAAEAELISFAHYCN